MHCYFIKYVFMVVNGDGDGDGGDEEDDDFYRESQGQEKRQDGRK